MNEKGTSVLEQYTFQVIRTMRGRGAVLCDTNAGLKLLKEYRGTCGKLETEAAVLKAIASTRQVRVDTIVENAEGKLISTDADGVNYIVKDWYGGQNPVMTDKKDLLMGAALLARLHLCMNGLQVEKWQPDAKRLDMDIPLDEQLKRRTRELKRVRNFIQEKRRKLEFERRVMQCFAENYKEAKEAMELLESIGYKEMRKDALACVQICHGSYNYHNIYFGNDWQAVVNFDRMHIGLQIQDFYGYLRKAMEKNQWNPELGLALYNTYAAIRPVSKAERQVLLVLLQYPEKFWKVLNYYFNTNKAWISERNLEKLEKVCQQQKLKKEFTLFLEKNVLK